MGGVYLVTTNTKNFKPIFGAVQDGFVCLNQYGVIVANEIRRIEDIFSNVRLHEYIVMPDHIHVLLEIVCRGGTEQGGLNPARPNCDINVNKACRGGSRPTRPRVRDVKSLSHLMSRLKGQSAMAINKIAPFHFRWHRGYHDHIIQNEIFFHRAVKYIRDNPTNHT